MLLLVLLLLVLLLPLLLLRCFICGCFSATHYVPDDCFHASSSAFFAAVRRWRKGGGDAIGGPWRIALGEPRPRNNPLRYRRGKDKEHVWEAKDKRTCARNKLQECEPDQGVGGEGQEEMRNKPLEGEPDQGVNDKSDDARLPFFSDNATYVTSVRNAPAVPLEMAGSTFKIQNCPK
jgi:hypothetical protein